MVGLFADVKICGDFVGSYIDMVGVCVSGHSGWEAAVLRRCMYVCLYDIIAE